MRMFKRKKPVKQIVLLTALSLLCVVFYTFIGVTGYGVFSERDYLTQTANITGMGERLEPFYFEINSFPKVVADDFLFLSNISSLHDLAHAETAEAKVVAVGQVQKDFVEFLDNSAAYYQVRYIDTDGYEVVRAQFDGARITLTPDDELQNKARQAYFQQATKLQEGEISLSLVELNMEHGALENRGTSLSPEYVPVLRFVMAIFNDDTKALAGTLVLNVYADYFLGDLRDTSRGVEQLFLVDQSGQYLVHADANKEFGNQLQTGENFARDYPEVAEQVLSQFQKRRLESETSVFALRHVFPATASFALSHGSMSVWGPQPNKNYFWVLVGVADKEQLARDTEVLESYQFFMGMAGVLLVLIIGLIAANFTPTRRRKKT